MAKQLSRFNKFQDEIFFKNLELGFIDTEDWADFETKKILGIKIKVIIKKDNNIYGQNDMNENITDINKGEVLAIKLRDIFKHPDLKMFETVKVVDPESKIYGEFSNQLSIIAKDVVAVTLNQKGA